MLEGFDGHLVAEQFIEQRLAEYEPDTDAQAFLARLREWRRHQPALGPATSERVLLEAAATPLVAALGFHALDDAHVSAHGWIAARAQMAHGAVAMIIARYGEPLGPLTRVALREAATRATDWCLLFNGTHLRLLFAARAASRRYIELDLDAAVDDERSGLALWMVAGSVALCEGKAATSTARLVRESDRHATLVCRSLKNGVLAAAARIMGAVLARASRASLDDAFAQSLTLVYRVLFLFFAEARGLVPLWHPIYRESYSLQRLCELAAHPQARGLWDSLQAINRLAHAGCRAGDLRVTAYNGRLFAPARAPLVELSCLAEDAARDTLIALSTRPATDGEGRARIAYRDLGVEQLGAVYETVLDYAPVVASDHTAGHPRRRSPANVSLRAGSSARKRTGSFYTPEPLARFLIRRTLGPLVREVPPERILALRVLDPSMGSGAFLVSACRYLADAYAEALVSSGGCHPTDLGPAERSRIRRTIAERCLFGVDLNPMAVQLAQLSLWLATLSADRPLGFLDHHLVTGNSVMGVWLSTLRQAPLARRRRETLPLFGDDAAPPMLQAALPVRFSLTHGPTDTAAEVRHKERALQMLTGPDTPLSRWKRVADLWMAPWLDPGLRQITSLFPALADRILSGAGPLPSRIAEPFLERSASLATAHRAFHWELEFPEVFFTENGQRRLDGGFDAIIGNPPWDMLRDDTAGRTPSAAARVVRFARDSGVYRAQGEGHANCYQLFLERSLALLAPSGRIGMVLPSGLLADHGSATLRRCLFSAYTVETIAGFENRRAIFDIHRSVRFVLLSAQAGTATGTFRCRLGETDPDVLERACDDYGETPQDQWPVRVSPTTLERVSGADLAVPDVRSPLDLAIVDRAATRFPRLGSTESWGARFGRELNATEDRGVFADAGARTIPVIEGKHLDPFRVRREDARFSISPSDARARLGERHLRPRLAYRDVASATNRQTLIAALLPAHAVSTHTLLCLKTPLPRVAQWFLCGLFNSYVVNYLVRLRVTTHVTTSIVEQLPIPSESDAGPAVTTIASLARVLSRAPRPDAAAMLQARVARLYELTYDEFAHVLATFPLVEPHTRQAAMMAFRAW